MSIIQHSKEEIMNELIHLRKRNEELELKLQEKNTKCSKILNNYSVNQLEIEALKESENLYKTLFENTEDGFEIVELLYDDSEKAYDYRWIKVNKAWEKQVGLKSACLEGKKASDIYSVVEDYWLERYDRVIKSVKSERYEIYGEETRRWFDCICFPYTERKVGVLFKDITKKKHTENTLVESEQLYRTLFENTEDIFQINELTYDDFGKVSDYKLTKVNDVFEIHTGLNAADVIGKQAKNIFNGDLTSRIEKLNEVKNSNKVERYEYYSEDTKRWYDILCFPYDKGLVGELFRDITEHKEYERKIAIHAEILSNVQDAVVVTDENIVITYCNSAFINLFGWNEHEIIGKSIYNFLNTYIDTASKAEIRKLLKNNDNLPDDFQFKELSCFCKDGKKVIIDLNISRLKKTNDDNFKGFITSIRDVSQRVEDLNKLQQSEKNAKKLIEKLRRADENKNEFLNMLSHEIRNPLAAAMLSLSLLNSVNENSVQATKAKGTLKRQLKHLSCLVDDLLDVTRIKTNKINLNKEILEINELIQNVVIDHRSQFNKKEVVLQLESSLSPLYIEADNVRITQALDNLLNNAVKFTQNGDTTILKVERDENKYEVVITIKDTGIGIAPELQPYLFDPFMQVDNSMERSNGGLGLGLAIVKGMVELHGGSVKVFSEGIGKGTQFTIRLPLINKIVEKKDKLLSKEKISSKTLNILMIDDNKDLTE
ncbi:MAG: luxQ 2, partial [Bacillota bacterium]|nr:luxQ 2 [Bacillota bacterium]